MNLQIAFEGNLRPIVRGMLMSERCTIQWLISGSKKDSPASWYDNTRRLPLMWLAMSLFPGGRRNDGMVIQM